MSVMELFDFVIDPTISDEFVDEYLEKVPLSLSLCLQIILFFCTIYLGCVQVLVLLATVICSFCTVAC